MKNSILIILTFVALFPAFAEAGSAKLISSTQFLQGEMVKATIHFDGVKVLEGTELYFPKRITLFEKEPDFSKIEFDFKLGEEFSSPKKEGKQFAGFIPKTASINLGDKKGFLLYFIPEWK